MQNRPFLVRALFDELPLKVLSLVIAVTLFAVVRSDKDAATFAHVKVLYTLPSDRVLVSEPVGEVRVGVRGPWTRLQRFDERGVQPIQVDLSQAQDGEYRFDETQVRLPVGLRVSTIAPPDVKLKFEAKVVRDVPVQVLLEGQAADGFRVTKVSSNPSTVKLEGARSVVESLERVSTTPLRVAGARMPVLGEVQLQPAPRSCRYLDPGPVVAQADVQPALAERTFDALPIKVVGLTRLEGTLDPPQARVILRGPSNLVLGVKLEQLGLSVDGALADTRAPSKYARNIAVTGLPPGIAAEVQPDTVTLSTHRRRD